jgi:hypothetical protein
MGFERVAGERQWLKLKSHGADLLDGASFPNEPKALMGGTVSADRAPGVTNGLCFTKVRA